MLKTSWKEKVKNVEVFGRINNQKSIWNTLRLRRKAWIGHLSKNSSWITTIIEGKIEGKPGRGRPRTAFIKQVMGDTGIKKHTES